MIKAPPRQRALPLGQWPHADREAWHAATAGGSVLRGSGRASHLAPSTIADLTRRYAYFLDFTRRGDRLEAGGPPAATVTPVAIAAYTQWLDAYASSVTTAGSVRKVLRLASCIAPDLDWTWLRELCQRLEASARPRNKRPHMVAIDQLSMLGFELMDRAERSERVPPFSRALTYRDGLIIAVLTASLVRRGNLSSLRVGAEVLHNEGAWTIAIPLEQSKNRRPIEVPLPAALSERIERYLGHYRRRFRNHDVLDDLWLSRNGRALCDNQLYKIVTRHTKEAFGKVVNPHLFRDCAATSIAVNHSAHIGIAAGALGHVDPRTTERYYNQAGMIEAARAYQSKVFVGRDEEPDAGGFAE